MSSTEEGEEGSRSPTRPSVSARPWIQRTKVGKGRLEPCLHVGTISLLFAALSNNFAPETPFTLAFVTNSMLFIREGCRKGGEGLSDFQSSGFKGNSWKIDI